MVVPAEIGLGRVVGRVPTALNGILRLLLARLRRSLRFLAALLLTLPLLHRSWLALLVFFAAVLAFLVAFLFGGHLAVVLCLLLGSAAAAWIALVSDVLVEILEVQGLRR